MGPRLVGAATLGLIVLFVAGALLTSNPRAAVDWQQLRAVVFESDDWGLAGFVPDAEAWQGLDRDELAPGSFPEVYWLSTLEDSVMVADLCAILLAHRGCDGRPAVFQPNYVMSSLEPSGDDLTWHRYDLPQFPPSYARPGLWSAVAEGIRNGVWHPEFHATWHFDPEMRRRNTAASVVATAAARRGIMLFPGGELARELGPWRPLSDLERELDGSLARFERIFGRRPDSTIAPDYTWNGRIESLWLSRGLHVIQGKREQRNPDFGHGRLGRARKYLERQWARVSRTGLVYLERNCRLEPVQAPDPRAVVESCLRDIRAAWRSGQPAVVETHRINFAHTDPAVVQSGQQSLASVLAALTADPAVAPTFLTDAELAQLVRRGTSVCARGGVVIVRNANRTRRVVTITADILDRAAFQMGVDARAGGPLLVALRPGEHRELVPGQHFARIDSHK